MSPRGRRPAGSDTRGEIVEAARVEFAESGYDAVSLRAVARRAGVDPALIHHYFDGKASLFAEVVDAPRNLDALIADLAEVPMEEIGRRMATNYLSVFEGDAKGADQFKALLRAAVSPEASELLSAYLEQEIFGKLVGLLALVHPEETTWQLQRRIGMATTQLVGLSLLRYVVKVPIFANISYDDMADGLGMVLQQYLMGDMK